MKFRLLQIVYLTMLLFQFYPGNVRGQHRWAVTGRAVDECGKAVPYAWVLVLPSDPPEGRAVGTITYEKADAKGRFRFERESTSTTESENFLYITSPFPAHTEVPTNLSPPFGISPKDHPQFGGTRIRFKNNEEVDVGDVRVQVNYGVLIVYLQDRKGRPLFTDMEDWEYIGLRVRDFNGKVVSEWAIPPADVREAVRVSESAISLALPEGVWRIEIAPAGVKQKWPFGLKGKILVSDNLIVKREKPTKVTLKSSK